MTSRKLLFVDRDGTLVAEPDDHQVDAVGKIRLAHGVIPALRRLLNAGYELVLVSNQDGLGSDSFPWSDFYPAHDFILHLLESQGITFCDQRICPHLPSAGCDCRKPGVGLLLDYLTDNHWNRAHSAVIGDRQSDLELAERLGVRGFNIDASDAFTWEETADLLLASERTATVRRNTAETRIEAHLDLDRAQPPQIATGHAFFDHMLDQLAAHGGFGLRLKCDGDWQVDDHHAVEDCALVIGQGLREALADKRGIGRYGFTLPMDESLASAAIDLSGRPILRFDGDFPTPSVGNLACEMVPHFFRSLSDSLACAIHINVRGENSHHMVEACFKATGRALRQAIARQSVTCGSDNALSTALPSTKGSL